MRNKETEALGILNSKVNRSQPSQAIVPNAPSPPPLSLIPSPPSLTMFRTTVRRLAAASSTAVTPPPIRARLTTGLTGLPVHSSPFPALLHTYTSTLSVLSQMPPSAVYRQSVESIIRDRVAAIEELGGTGEEKSIEAVEEKIGLGCIEEVLIMAMGELKLAQKMLEWKA